MREIHRLRPSSVLARSSDLAPFLFVVVLSLILGFSIPNDRGALAAALTGSAIGAAVVAHLWSGARRRALSKKSFTATLAKGVESGAAARPYLVPRELPPAPPGFVGRTEEIEKLLRQINDHRGRGPFIAAIYGAPGIGKSALAVTVAHKAARAFPDGQVFAQMRGAAGGGAGAAEIHDLIEHFVTSLKGPNDPLPQTEEELRAEYAALTERSAVLFVLDDVRPAIDITAVCPRGLRCAVIVTCRAKPDWPEVEHRRIPLEPLTASDAVSMLRTTVGADWQDKEERPYLELARRCGGQPLALRAAGTAVADRPNWDIGLITEQAKSARVLPASEYPHGGIFDAAYALLTTEEQRVLRVLGVLQQYDIAAWMIAVALGITEEKGRRLASRLAEAGLIERYSPGSGTPSYRAEEPVLAYARLCALAEDGGTDAARWRRLFEEERGRRLEPSDKQVGSLDDLLAEHGGFTPAIEAIRHAMSLSREQGSRLAEASAYAALADLYTDLGDIVTAEDLAQQAIEIGDDHSRGRAYRCLTRLERRRHRLALAANYADEAAACAVRVDDRAEQVRILVEKAVVVALEGEPARAEEISTDAGHICDQIQEKAGTLRAGIGWCRGRVWLHAGRYAAAMEALQHGKRLADEMGEIRLGAWIDHTSASVAMATRDWAAAEQHAIAGMDAFTALHHGYGAAHCRHRLGQIRLACGRIDDAVRFLRKSLESFHNCGDVWIESEVSLDLADAYRRNNQIRESLQMQRVARRAYRQLGGPVSARRANWLLARTLLGGIVPGPLRDLRGARPEQA